MVEVPPEGLYGFKDFSQIIKAIADIKLLNNAVFGSLGLREQQQELRQRVEDIEHSAANVSKFTDLRIQVDKISVLAEQTKKVFEELQRDIDRLSSRTVEQSTSIDRIWGQLGRMKAHSQELEDHITGEDTQLKPDEYDVEEML